MREHAVTAHPDLHLTPNTPISRSFSSGLRRGVLTTCIPASDYQRFGSACEKCLQSYLPGPRASALKMKHRYHRSTTKPYPSTPGNPSAATLSIALNQSYCSITMAIINEEIGNIFLAPPKSILIRKSLTSSALTKIHHIPAQ